MVIEINILRNEQVFPLLSWYPVLIPWISRVGQQELVLIEELSRLLSKLHI
jgi:hypothetical protein